MIGLFFCHGLLLIVSHLNPSTVLGMTNMFLYHCIISILDHCSYAACQPPVRWR